MDVITTHVNADFDCLGAMVAARKLYPEALMVFSGSQEKTMRDFFLKSTGYALDFTRIKDVDFDRITRLIIVDCQHSSRIGRFAEILGRDGLEVHIYDHHPGSSGDISSTGGMIRESGSTTTIITKLLMEQSLSVDSTEATLMMLGIYEDTGNLTFPSTTVDDYYASAWLLQHGANLNVISDFITQELTPEQVALLNDLLKARRILSVNGVDISIAEASVDYYIGDIAALVHMIRDMENLEALFVVVGMGNRVYVVARSRIPEVNVGEILKKLGGGGHATAASAAVKELTRIQVSENLERAIRELVVPRRMAKDIMSSPVKTVACETTIADANETLTRYNINAMPVLRDNQVFGIITRRIVEKALFHGLGGLPVSEYMHTEFMKAVPETPLVEIQEYFSSRDRRLAPVIDGESLVGVVTRTDLLRYMASGSPSSHDEAYDLGKDGAKVRIRNLEGLIEKQLPKRLRGTLRDIGSVGQELVLNVYAVGGFVRDILLRHPNMDIDITVEGDGILFAETFAERFGCRVRKHEKFGTAVIVCQDGLKIDVASTRLEYYESPGALPTVERSSLKLDLYRRDFTINTLAIKLTPPDFGQLIDFFGAYRDLNDRIVRVLHNLSFVEDPTRVFRAIRFEQRLGFSISSHTEKLLRSAVKLNFPQKVGGRRLYGELVQIFKEEDPSKAIERMASFDLLKYLHPVLKFDDHTRKVVAEAGKVLAWYTLLYRDEPCERWLVYFLALCDSLTPRDIHAVTQQLDFPASLQERLSISLDKLFDMTRKLSPYTLKNEDLQRSLIVHSLSPIQTEVLLYFMASTTCETMRKAVSLYLSQLQDVRTVLTGKDLMKLGVPEGPLFGKILEELYDAKLDGEVISREDEIAFVRGRMAHVC